MNAALPVLVLSAVFFLVALAQVTSGPSPQGTPCSPGNGPGQVASDHSALWIQETTSTATSGATGDIASGCLLEGASVAVQVFSPSTSLKVTVAEYDTAYAANDTWHPAVYNGTPSALNLTRPGYWSNLTVSYWGDPVWRNVTITNVPYSFTSVPLSPPAAYSERHLFVGYDNATWTFWYETPASLLGAGLSIGSAWGIFAAWLVILGVAAGLAVGVGAAAMEDLLAPPRRRGSMLVVIALLGTAALVGGSYLADPDAWAQHLGSGWAYLLLILPEFWALTALVIFVWPTKATLQGEYRDNGDVTEDKSDAIDLPAIWVFRKPGVGRVHVPRGVWQAVKRLALGELAYVPLRDKLVTKHPAYVSVNGVVASLVVLGGDVEETFPHAEFWTRDPLEKGVPKVDKDGHPNKGRLRFVRWVPGERRRPVLSEGGTKAVLDRLAERREIDQIAGDVTSLEDEIVEARSETHVGAARRGRKLLKDYLLAVREAVEDEKPGEGEGAVHQADKATGAAKPPEEDKP